MSEDQIVVRSSLAKARALVRVPGELDGAIHALESLTRSLAPDAAAADVQRAKGVDTIRAVLSSHLLAVQALRDVEAQPAKVERLVRRAIDAAEEAALARA